VFVIVGGTPVTVGVMGVNVNVGVSGVFVIVGGTPVTVGVMGV